MSGRRRGADHGLWRGEDVGYNAVHVRLMRMRGRAWAWVCVRCGGMARHWAYDHLDPDERVDQQTGLVYSTNLAHYRPMCVPCHMRADRGARGKFKKVGP